MADEAGLNAMPAYIALSSSAKARSFSFLVALSLSAATLCHAQDYPQRIVKLVVPYAPGGGIDILARVVADGFTRRWKQPMIVENRPGASSLIGTEAVVRAPPDGLTLLFAADSPITGNPHLFKTMPFDPIKELVLIVQLVKTNTFVVVNPAVGVSTLRELVALAKQKPNELPYSSYGAGTPPHLVFEAMRTETGSQISHIPYKGAIAANTATVTGEVQMSVLGASSLPLIRAGKLKVLAACSPSRVQALLDVVTCAEAGFARIDPSGWAGLFAPVGTPAAIISKINADAVEMLNNPDFVARGYDRDAFSKVGSTPADFARFIREDFEDKGRLIRNAGIVPE